MQSTVETLAGLERRLTLSLPTAEIETEAAKRLQRLSKSVKLDGFRPGKAPMNMISQRYGAEVRGDVLGEALQQRFYDSVREQDIKVAGYPNFESAGNEPGAVELTFKATFEVFPEVKLGDIGQIKITRPVAEVKDEDIDRTIEVLRKQRVQYRAADRAAQAGDRLHMDYVGRIGGEIFQGGEAKDFPVVLGEGRLLKDFEDALTGMKAGEHKTFDMTFPADYFGKDVAGKTATFEVTVKSVHEAQMPELDDAFAHSMGVDQGVAKLRQDIGDNLKREAKRRIQSRVKEQVVEALLKATPFDVPKGLIAMERQAMMERAVHDLQARGMKTEDIKLSDAVFETQAQRRVAVSLLLGELAKANGIVAREEQVKAMVEEFAQSYENPAEVVAWYYADRERLREVSSLVLEENIVEWVLGKAQVSDEAVTMETLMGKA
ncbi:MAG: trigger factor [Betaproteobacteria bacterium]|nr:trigger factor [Betaproteobacteria bacterium]